MKTEKKDCGRQTPVESIRREYIPREIRIRVQRESWGPGLQVYVQGEQCAKNIYLGAGFEVQKWASDNHTTEPYLPGMDDNRAQELMDELWRCGVRPSDGRRTDEAMGALGNHLEDMRKIAFRLFDGITDDSVPDYCPIKGVD